MPTRRQLLQVFGASALAGRLRAGDLLPRFARRTLGRTGRWVSPFGLGGQAALQYPPPDLDSAAIPVRAVELGVNYLDTANAYGPSQANYGEAFRRLSLDQAARERLFIASKTGNRYAINPAAPNAATALSDLRRSLTTLFGDGNGHIHMIDVLACDANTDADANTHADAVARAVERHDYGGPEPGATDEHGHQRMRLEHAQSVGMVTDSRE